MPRIYAWDKGQQAERLRLFLSGLWDLPSIRFHDLRATWATILLSQGIAPIRVMMMGGWKNLKTMQYYVRKVGVDLTGMIDNLNLHNPNVTSRVILDFLKAIQISPLIILLDLAVAFSRLSYKADNIYYHSGLEEGTGWGYVHAQTYEDYIQLSICDVGVGVYKSYERTKQLRNRSEEDLIFDIFNEGESSLNNGPKGGHRGLGLCEVKDFISEFEGCLKMYTGSVEVTIKGEEINSESTPYKTEGTWIKINVPIR